MSNPNTHVVKDLQNENSYQLIQKNIHFLIIQKGLKLYFNIYQKRCSCHISLAVNNFLNSLAINFKNKVPVETF